MTLMIFLFWSCFKFKQDWEK